jgi:hypothetical protein
MVPITKLAKADIYRRLEARHVTSTAASAPVEGGRSEVVGRRDSML